jgi:hypothetical protein
MDPPNRAAPLLAMQQFFAGATRGLVDAQLAFDEVGRESILRWEQNGIPPAVWTVSDIRLSFPIAVALRPKASHAGRTTVALAPRPESQGRLTLGFRYLLTPQDAEDP